MNIIANVYGRQLTFSFNIMMNLFIINWAGMNFIYDVHA